MNSGALSCTKKRTTGVDLLTLTTGCDDWCLTLGAPDALQGRIRPFTRFIDEEDVGTESFGACLQLGIVLLFPLGDRYGVALIGAPERLLRRDLEFRQKPTRGRHAGLFVKSFFD
jgi:hypothetical protein